MALSVSAFIIIKILAFSSTVLSQEPSNSKNDLTNEYIMIHTNGTSFPSELKTLSKPHDHHFDFLMFTQLWPISNCIDWEERDHDNTCSLNGKLLSFITIR